MSESQESWRLLVLEDDPNLRQVLSDVLSDEGYHVVAVDNGEAAVQLASQQPFDLIITDIRMDGTDGLQALERARGYQPELSSLVVSGYTTEAETLRALQLNVGGYLKKPFSLSDFLQRTRELLLQRRAQREQRQSLLRLRNSFWWALQSVGEQAQQRGRLALFLARQLGLPGEQCQNVRWAAVLQGEREGPLAQWPAAATQDSLGLGPVIALIQEKEPLSPAAQAVQLACRLCQDEPGGADIAWDESLRKFAEQPDLVDSPQVLAALAEHEKELGVSSLALQQRSLLGLALTLEERGELATSQVAYQRLSDDTQAGAEMRLQAQVGAARVGWLSGQANWYDALKEAERASRALGPLAGALQRWPIATLLLRSGHASAESYLAQLEKELLELGLVTVAAKARVARAGLRKDGAQDILEAARLLLSPQMLGEVAHDCDWLVPYLLTLAPLHSLPVGPAWGRLLCEFPQATLRWLKDAPASCVGYLLQSLEATPELTPARILEGLAEHPDAEVKRRASALQARLQGERPSTFLRFRSFGYFEVFVNGERVADNLWKTQKFKFLLAYLVARRGQPVHEEVLVEEFWPDSRGTAKASVYSATTTLRRCLRAGSGEKGGEFVIRDGDQLYFDAKIPCWHDVEEFEQAFQGLAQGTPEAINAARQAASLLNGPYLQGCYLDWAQRKRNQLDEAAIRLFTQLAQDSLEQRPQEALDYAQKGLDLDPLSQECHLLRMQGFLKLAQPERAMKQYSLCERELKRELGIEPLTSLVEAFYRAKLAL